MKPRTPFCVLVALTLVAAAAGGAYARDFEMGGDNQFPYSIMTPEPGTAPHHRARKAAVSRSPTREAVHPSLLGHEHFVRKLHQHGKVATRGSSGIVLPTPLPRTPLIPPEGGGTITTHPLPQQPGPTIVPTAPTLGAVPNLPHGSETFQDRAARCAFQGGLYNVPGNLRNQYMGGCVQ